MKGPVLSAEQHWSFLDLESSVPANTHLSLTRFLVLVRQTQLLLVANQLSTKSSDWNVNSS